MKIAQCIIAVLLSGAPLSGCQWWGNNGQKVDTEVLDMSASGVDTLRIGEIDNSLEIPDCLPLRDMYLVNGNTVYGQFDNKRYVLHVDAATFKIDYTNFDYEPLGVFAYDKNGVYFCGRLVTRNSHGFKLLGAKSGAYLWRAGGKVYKDREVVAVSDPDTFEPVGGCVECAIYFKDKDYLYYFDKRIEGSQPAAVPDYNWYLPCDGQYFYEGESVLEYEGEAVKPLSQTVGVTSKYGLFINHTDAICERLPAYIDLPTLKPLGNAYIMDKNGVYYLSELVDLKGNLRVPIAVRDSASIRAFGLGEEAYITDGKRVYYQRNTPVKGVDAQTFVSIEDSGYCYDKNGVYVWSYKKVNEDEYKDKWDKIPFDYHKPVKAKDLHYKQREWIAYGNEILYGFYGKPTFGKLTAAEMKAFLEGHLSLKDDDGKLIATANTEDSSPSEIVVTNFYKIANGYMYCNDYRLMESEDFEVVASYGDDYDHCPKGTIKNLDVVKNKEGYWLIHASWNKMPTYRYIGKEWKPKER